MTPNRFPFSQAAPGVCELQPYQPGKPAEELERELGISNAIKLASNENPRGCSPSVITAIRSCSSMGVYPDANGFTLKSTLAGQLGVDTSQITLGNGSNDVLDLVARVFVRPGDEVIFSEFAFLVYPLVTRAVGGVAVVTQARDFKPDLGSMARAVTGKTKLIFIANPNNPTGAYVSKSDLQNFMEIVPDHIVVVLDEAYFEYVTADDYPNCIAWCRRYANLIVTRTFSKAYGLAGLRIGFSIASEEITDLLNRVRQPFNVNGLALVAATAAIEDPGHVQRSVKENHEQLDRLVSFCQQQGVGYIPSVANFLTVETGPRTHQINRELLHKGIIVRPLQNYNMPEQLRITTGRASEMDRLFDGLRSVL